MIPLERHERILQHLTSRRYLGVEQAQSLLGASSATIRRDFNELAEKGLAHRTRGGLRRLDHVEDGAMPYAFRAGQYAEEKGRIARHAMSLLHPGDTVFVDGGTTTYHLARFLPSYPLTVITNSVRLASVLGERVTSPGPLRVLLSGGALHPEAGILVGPQATRTLAEYRADWAFISPGGLNAGGIYNANEEIAACERAMMAHAEETVVLAHPGKFGRTACCWIAGLESIGRVIGVVDARLGPNREMLEESGVPLELAPALPQ